MKRIDTTNAVADLFGAGKPGFGPGNPSTNTPATFLDEEWCNHIQEEIANFIEASGAALDPSKKDQMKTALQSILGAGPKVIDLSAASAPVLLDKFNEVHVVTRNGLNSMIWTQMVPGGIYEMSIKAYGYGAQNADWRLRPNATSYATQFFSSNVSMTGTTTASAVAARNSSEASFFVDTYSGTTGENLVATAKLYPETASWKYLHAQSADSNGVAMTSSVWVNTSTPWTTVGELQLWSGAAGGQGSVPNPSLVNSTVRIRRIA